MEALARPPLADLPEFYHGYVAEATGVDLFDALCTAQRNLHGTLATVTTELAEHRYAPGKWSIKEVVQHVIDAERIFAYRALRFARNDGTALPGFDENAYTPASHADRRALKDLLDELDLVRASTLALFRSLPSEALDRSGTANNNRITVRAIGWTIAGHSDHHARILAERYLNIPRP